MHRRISTLLLTAGLLGAALALAPAVAAGDPCYHGYSIPPASSAATSTVRMQQCAFLPTNAEVAPGATVTFVNDSYETHLLTGANQAWGDRDKEIAPGASVTARFDEAGVYAFSCALHRGMTGAVIVGDVPAAAAAATTNRGSATGPVDASTVVLVVGLAALALAGWAMALAQRRRMPALTAANLPGETPVA